MSTTQNIVLHHPCSYDLFFVTVMGMRTQSSSTVGCIPKLPSPLGVCARVFFATSQRTGQEQRLLGSLSQSENLRLESLGLAQKTQMAKLDGFKWLGWYQNRQCLLLWTGNMFLSHAQISVQCDHERQSQLEGDLLSGYMDLNLFLVGGFKHVLFSHIFGGVFSTD